MPLNWQLRDLSPATLQWFFFARFLLALFPVSTLQLFFFFALVENKQKSWGVETGNEARFSSQSMQTK